MGVDSREGACVYRSWFAPTPTYGSPYIPLREGREGGGEQGERAKVATKVQRDVQPMG